MTNRVRLNKNKLLEQQASLLKRENERLRSQLASVESELARHLDEAAQGEELQSCDLNALQKKREFIEYRSGTELKLNERVKAKSMEERAACEGKTALFCLIQDLQLWKFKLAEAELAGIISQMWNCKTQNYEDCIGDLVERINKELERCSDVKDPFLVDAINEVLKGC